MNTYIKYSCVKAKKGYIDCRPSSNWRCRNQNSTCCDVWRVFRRAFGYIYTEYQPEYATNEASVQTDCLQDGKNRSNQVEEANC